MALRCASSETGSLPEQTSQYLEALPHTPLLQLSTADCGRKPRVLIPKKWFLQMTASAEHNPELLAAMRGAGSVFGVVTQLTLALYDVTNYIGGHLVLLDDINTSNHRSDALPWKHGRM